MERSKPASGGRLGRPRGRSLGRSPERVKAAPGEKARRRAAKPAPCPYLLVRERCSSRPASALPEVQRRRGGGRLLCARQAAGRGGRVQGLVAPASFFSFCFWDAPHPFLLPSPPLTPFRSSGARLSVLAEGNKNTSVAKRGRRGRKGTLGMLLRSLISIQKLPDFPLS